MTVSEVRKYAEKMRISPSDAGTTAREAGCEVIDRYTPLIFCDPGIGQTRSRQCVDPEEEPSGLVDILRAQKERPRLA